MILKYTDESNGVHMSSNRAVVLEAARDFVRKEADALGSLIDQLDDSFLDTVDTILDTTGKVITTGSGTSGIIAERFAHLMAVTGTPALYLPAMDALHGGMGAITPGDTVIGFSKGGRSSELIDLITRLGERGIRTIAVTENGDSGFARAAAAVVVIRTTPSEADPGGLIAMGSTLVAGAWSDAVSSTLMRMRRYEWSEVLDIHPAGVVGTQTDLPAPVDELPREQR